MVKPARCEQDEAWTVHRLPQQNRFGSVLAITNESVLDLGTTRWLRARSEVLWKMAYVEHRGM